VVLAIAVAAGCSSPTPTPVRSPTPTVSSSAGLSTSALALQQLAQASARASYLASYVFHRRAPATSVIVRVWHSPSSLRVDVVAAGQTATLIITPAGSYSCGVSRHRRLCFRVARAGRPVPVPFSVSPATLFSTDLRQLADDTAHYLVGPAAPTVAQGPVPAATCFAVTAGPAASSPRVPAGTYCFAPAALTSVTYPSGNTVQLTAWRSVTPPASVFRPYATPTPLPG
jgi:hypothetical protein